MTVKRRSDGEPVNSEALRSVPVAELVRYAGAAVHYIKERQEQGGMTIEAAWPSEEDGAYVARHRLDDETLPIVARIYWVAYLIRDPPTQKVEKLLNLPRSTAGRWVSAARKGGFLAEAGGPGKAGG